MATNIQLKSTYVVPGLGYKEVYTGSFADNGIESYFRRNYIGLFLESDAFYIGSGNRDLDTQLYMFPEPLSLDFDKHSMISSGSKSEMEAQLRHQRLAHLNALDLINVHKYVTGVPKLGRMEEVCRTC